MNAAELVAALVVLGLWLWRELVRGRRHRALVAVLHQLADALEAAKKRGCGTGT